MRILWEERKGERNEGRRNSEYNNMIAFCCFWMNQFKALLWPIFIGERFPWASYDFFCYAHVADESWSFTNKTTIYISKKIKWNNLQVVLRKLIMFHVVWDAPRALVSARVRGAFFFLSCNFSHCFGGFLIQSLYLTKKKNVSYEIYFE